MTEKTQNQSAGDPSLEDRLRDQAVNIPHSGTSVFTHVDDAGADIHAATVPGARRLFYGEPMPPKHQIEEIVLGPAPFGSPDPRTLGHRMVPIEEGPASAPELDEDFVRRQRANFAGNVDEETLDDLTKDELYEGAEQLGVDVNKSMTKDEIKQAIVDHQEKQAAGNQAEGNQSEGNTLKTEDGKPYSELNKAELLEEAKRLNVDVDETNSKAEIRDALEKNNTANNEKTNG